MLSLDLLLLMTNKLHHTSPTEVHAQSKRALTLLTAVNYLNYIDRYMLAALLVSIKTDLNLNDFQAGLLATAFMVPYMFTSPFFGYLGDRIARPKILAGGASVWSIASLITGMAGSFNVLLGSRFLLGLGESGFTTVSPPFIADFFTAERRGRVLSIFSSALPVGAALGFVLGGVLGQLIGWRAAFMFAGVPGLILAFLVIRLPDPRHKILPENFIGGSATKILGKNKPYLLTVLGFAAYTFVVGGLAHWTPSFVQRSYGIDEMKANLLFGGIAVVSGFLGTMLGGHWGDALSKKYSVGFEKSFLGHLKISYFSMLMSAPFYIGYLFAPNLIVFIICMSITQFCFFLSTSPINVVIIESVPAYLRSTGMAMAIFACHLLGDAISSPLIGWISDQTGSLRTGMLAVSPIILLSATFWFLAHKSHKIQKN